MAGQVGDLTLCLSNHDANVLTTAPLDSFIYAQLRNRGSGWGAGSEAPLTVLPQALI